MNILFKREMAKVLNREFTKEKKVSKLMKKCSAQLVIKEMQVETTRRYLLIPATEAKIEKTGNTRS
jgi:hypothetical protein